MLAAILAQTNEVANWAGVVTAVTSMGFSVVVGWYLLTKGMPEMLTKFTESLKAERDHFDRIDERRHQEHKADLEVVVKHCERESAHRDETLRSELSIVNKALEDTGEVMEEVRRVLLGKANG